MHIEKRILLSKSDHALPLLSVSMLTGRLTTRHYYDALIRTDDSIVDIHIDHLLEEIRESQDQGVDIQCNICAGAS
jgi:hypothetical protein